MRQSLLEPSDAWNIREELFGGQQQDVWLPAGCREVWHGDCFYPGGLLLPKAVFRMTMYPKAI
ncbi:hypothetical protein [Paenibacillus pinihumi]|uniref:hypothetical protein n=1 Tax=Paenibacillus pinihumi TaxID=669462 RepID=UPI0012B574D4|nr:hypothetical protein [Paenibacillus pinihumi]